MANTKSAQKQARQNIVKRQKNLARRTALKTVLKKVLVAIETKSADAQSLLREAHARLARAKSKGVMHARTASRKASRLAKRLLASVKA